MMGQGFRGGWGVKGRVEDMDGGGVVDRWYRVDVVVSGGAVGWWREGRCDEDDGKGGWGGMWWR